MKHFIYLLITLILTGFIISAVYLQITYGGIWAISLIPLGVMSFCWGYAVVNEYNDK